MNVENLNKLIAHLEAQPPELINMGQIGIPECGTPGCIMGHIKAVTSRKQVLIEDYLGVTSIYAEELACPDGWVYEGVGRQNYPAHRVIATLKRLRDTYLTTGQVVVDWGPEPGEEPKQTWTAPQVAEVIAPTLPAEITSLLRPSLAKTEA